MNEVGYLIDRIEKLNSDKDIRVGENIEPGVGFSSLATGIPGIMM